MVWHGDYIINTWKSLMHIHASRPIFAQKKKKKHQLFGSLTGRPFKGTLKSHEQMYDFSLLLFFHSTQGNSHLTVIFPTAQVRSSSHPIFGLWASGNSVIITGYTQYNTRLNCFTLSPPLFHLNSRQQWNPYKVFHSYRSTCSWQACMLSHY